MAFGKRYIGNKALSQSLPDPNFLPDGFPLHFRKTH
jgi:hypothetical protein